MQHIAERLRPLAAAALLLGACGCAMFNDTATHITPADPIGPGQELLDLRKALHAGTGGCFSVSSPAGRHRF